MFRVVRSCYIDMAHRIRGHKGKCQRLHGHTWKIEVSLSADTLDELGMVMDFGDIKTRFLNLLENHFDHTLLLGEDDWKALAAVCEYSKHGRNKTFDRVEKALAACSSTHVGPRLGVHTIHFNVTAERLAEHFYKVAVDKLMPGQDRVRVDYVRVYEKLHPTESYAEYSRKECV